MLNAQMPEPMTPPGGPQPPPIQEPDGTPPAPAELPPADPMPVPPPVQMLWDCSDQELGGKMCQAPRLVSPGQASRVPIRLPDGWLPSYSNLHCATVQVWRRS